MIEILEENKKVNLNIKLKLTVYAGNNLFYYVGYCKSIDKHEFVLFKDEKLGDIKINKKYIMTMIPEGVNGRK